MKNILLSHKKEADRLGILEMGFELNGAGKIEGPVEEEILKKLKGKAVVSFKGEEGSIMGQKEIGLIKTKEMSLSGVIGMKHNEAQELKVKSVEPVSTNLTVYSRQTPTKLTT